MNRIREKLAYARAYWFHNRPWAFILGHLPIFVAIFCLAFIPNWQEIEARHCPDDALLKALGSGVNYFFYSIWMAMYTTVFFLSFDPKFDKHYDSEPLKDDDSVVLHILDGLMHSIVIFLFAILLSPLIGILFVALALSTTLKLVGGNDCKSEEPNDQK